MFKKHPKGLLAAILVNMGERLGFYTMMAVFVSFLMGKFNLNESDTGEIYACFYFLIFVFTILGGIIGDKTRNHKGMVGVGLILMAIGYFIIAIFSANPANQMEIFLTITCLGLFIITVGNGLYKVNLRVMIGQLYDNPHYSNRRDAGFSMYYIFLNISILFIPFIVNAINHFQIGLHFAFAISVVAMTVSLIIYWFNKEKFLNSTTHEVPVIKMDSTGIRQRFYVLFAVIAVMGLFSFAFSQKEITLMFFARDYTNIISDSFTNLQSLSPRFIVLLMPELLIIFALLRARGKEPSAPKKMAIGMGIAAVAFLVIAVVSIGLPMPTTIYENGLSHAEKVNHYWLISTFFILVIAELFVAPVGISVVSKISPPKHQGLMQSLWAVGVGITSPLLFLSSRLYGQFPPWVTWTIFAFICLISMLILLLMMKWIEKIAR